MTKQNSQAEKRVVQLHVLTGLEAMFSALMHEVSIFIKVVGGSLESEVSVGALFGMGLPLFAAGVFVLATTGRIREGARRPLVAACFQLAVVAGLIVIYSEPRGVPHLVLPTLDVAALLWLRGRLQTQAGGT